MCFPSWFYLVLIQLMHLLYRENVKLKPPISVRSTIGGWILAHSMYILKWTEFYTIVSQ